MKLKLVALLFSQAASALDIDKSNYKYHLCDQALFTPLSTIPASSELTQPYLQEAFESNIRNDYQNYCTTKFEYEEAVEFQKTASWRAHTHCGLGPRDLITPVACTEKRGILYAQACEKLKQDRDATPASWNAVIPKLVTCNNM